MARQNNAALSIDPEDPRVDAILTRFARSLPTDGDRRSGHRGLKPRAIWGAGLAVARLGPHRQARSALKQLYRTAPDWVEVSPPGPTLWIAADIGTHEPGATFADSRKLARFVRWLEGALRQNAGLGARLFMSRGLLGRQGPFGQAMEAASASEMPALQTFWLAEPVARALQGLGLPLHSLGEGRGAQLDFTPAPTWIQRAGELLGQGMQVLLGGDMDLSGLSLAVSPQRRTRRASLEKDGDLIEPLDPGDALRVSYQVPDDSFVYLILQSDADLDLVGAGPALRRPGQLSQRSLTFSLDENQATERPMLLLSLQPLPDLPRLVEEVNRGAEDSADARVQALHAHLVQAGAGAFALVHAGRFAHGGPQTAQRSRQLAEAEACLQEDDFEEAARRLHRLLQEDLSPGMRARAQVRLGRALRKQRRFEQAQGAFEAARVAAARAEATGLEADAARGLARCLVEQGRGTEALPLLERAIYLHGELEDQLGEAKDILEKGTALRLLDRLAEARRCYEQAAQLAEALEARALEGDALAGLGQVVHDLGRPEEAKIHYRAARDAFIQAGKYRGQMRAASDLGLSALATGNAEQALKAFEAELGLAIQFGGPREQAFARLDLGTAHEALAEQLTDAGRGEEARAHLLEARRNLMSAEEELKESSPLYASGIAMLLGRLALQLGELEQAEKRLGQLDPRSSELPLDLRWTIALSRGRLQEAQGQHLAAEASYRAGVEAIEEVRSALPHLLRADFLENSERLFDHWLSAQRHLGSPAEALLEGVERSRARALLDALVASERQRDSQDLDLFELAEWLPETHPRPVQALQQSLDGAQDLVVFHALPEELLAFRVTADEVSLQGSPIPRRQLAALCRRAERWTAEPGRAEGASQGSPWEELTELLAPLFPWSEGFADDRPLGVVLQGPLYGVPLHALPLGPEGQALLMGRPVFYLPSLQAFGRWMERPPSQAEGLLALAYPDGNLAHAAGEARSVAAQLGQGQVLVEGEATRRALAERGPHAALLHLVCHGRRGGEGRPAQLILAGDEGPDPIEPGWIARQHLSELRLVTLSACESGAGRLSGAGEGPDLLSWAFLRAGARATIASGWKVDDRATAALMDLMYSGLAKGHSPLMALTKAQRAFIRGADVEASGVWRGASLEMAAPVLETEDPAYWAAFSLVGDGGR